MRAHLPASGVKIPRNVSLDQLIPTANANVDWTVEFPFGKRPSIRSDFGSASLLPRIVACPTRLCNSLIYNDL